ncbi:MAG: DUF4352 domain-containing protein [Anaerolineae bacterium]
MSEKRGSSKIAFAPGRLAAVIGGAVRRLGRHTPRRSSAAGHLGWRAALLAAAVLSGSVAVAQGNLFRVYLPLVYEMTPTPMVTVTPVAGTCVAAGGTVRFRDRLHDLPLEGEVAECFRVRDFTLENDTVLRPAEGTFVVVMLDVRNRGTLPAEVGLQNAFRLQVSGGFRYDLATLVVQEAAAEAYGRPTVYSPISAGATVRQVFTFEVPESATGLTLVSEYSW